MSAVALAFFPVPVDTLIGETRTEFDLYVQLNSKHVLYLRKGGEFDVSRIEKLREKNVQNIWVSTNEARIYKNFCERRLAAPYDMSVEMAPVDRSNVIVRSLTTATEALLKNPGNGDVYNLARDSARRVTDFLLKHDEGLKIILHPSIREHGVCEHGVAVAAIAVALAKQLGHSDAKDLHLLALGCMIHDAGYYGQTNTVFGRKTGKFSADELRSFNEHVMEGARIFQSYQHVDQHVSKIIIEHEEHIDGTGFPKGLKEKQMHAYSVIASTANAFENVLRHENVSAESALKAFFVDRIGRHPLPHLNALKVVVQSLKK